MMKNAIRWAVASACLVLGPMTWAQAPGVTDKEIVLGAITPFKGPAGPLGYAGLLGSRIAVGEINDAGGISGRKLRLVGEDDDYVPARTVQAMQKLIDVDKVFAITSASGAAHFLAVMPMLEEQGIPSVNPLVASMASFTPIRRTHFGIGMSYREGAYALMKVLAARKPNLKWASIVQDDESGIDQEVGYKQAVAELKLNSVAEIRYKRSQTDFSSEVLRLKESGATGIYLGSLPVVTAAILKEARRLDMNPTYGAIWTTHVPQVFGLFSEAADGMAVYDFVPSIDAPSSAPLRELAKKHLDAGELGKLNRYTILGYMSVKVLAEAIRKCGRDVTRACVVTQIEALKNFPSGGLMAPISFGPSDHLTKVSGQVLKIDFANKTFVPY